jgi:cytochrome c-type biogenesis protein CcmH/NrfF
MSRTFMSFAVLSIGLGIFAGALALPANGEAQDDRSARIARLEDAVLAPCCYREPVSQHQSEIALKMRLEIARWVAAGRTDAEILSTYVTLYGAKVLVDPRTKPEWWTPWIPWLAVIFSMGSGFWLLRKWRAKAVLAGAPAGGPELAALPDFGEDE